MKVSTIRDGQGHIVGTTTNFSNSDTIARNRSGHILGRSSQTFNHTRGPHDRLVSNNSANTDLLFRK